MSLSHIFAILFAIFLSFNPFTFAQAQSQKSPFFLKGDGHLKIKNTHTGRLADVKYLNEDGSLNDAAFAIIDQVFGFNTALMGENISRRLLGQLDYFSDLTAPGKVIMLVSGYRSQGYNNKLRAQGKTAAKTSTHIDGMALDFYLDGINGFELWEKIRKQNCCGVGNYNSNIVHLDAGRPRFWQKETAKVHTGDSDFNRYIYLSSEYDRYETAQKIRLLFTSISDFGFGIKRHFEFLDEEGNHKIASGEIQTNAGNKDECVMINQRKEARFISTAVPDNLKNGKYRIQLEFCSKPFVQMPDEAISNVIEVF